MNKYKLIIVENDEDEQLFMKDGFNSSGLFQLLAQLKNGDAMLEWLEEHKGALPDVILSDLNMPGKNGFDVLNDVKTNPDYAHIPVIITSTSTARTMVERCMAAGAADYVAKPETFIEYVPYAKRLYDLIENKKLVRSSTS